MSEISESTMRGLTEMLEHIDGKIELRSSQVSISPPKSFTADDVRAIRDRLHMSQGFFAEVIGVSKKTVEAWEYGKGRPSGAAARVLSIAEKDPEALKHFGFANW